MTSDHRAPPLSEADWPLELADLKTGFAGALNVYRTMAHHPALLRSWAALREHIVNGSALDPAELEVVILRAGHRLQSDYEWSHHVERARHRGLSDKRILSMRGPLSGMKADDALLAKAVDELFDTSRLAPATLQRVIDRFGKPAVLDLMATVGFYATLGFILNSFETPLDADVADRLAANPLRG